MNYQKIYKKNMKDFEKGITTKSSNPGTVRGYITVIPFIIIGSFFEWLFKLIFRKK